MLGHRQAFAWIDEWHGMTIKDVRDYEHRKQLEANDKVLTAAQEQQAEENKPACVD